jgi:hypothetical protein
LAHARAVTYFQPAAWGRAYLLLNDWDPKVMDRLRTHPQLRPFGDGQPPADLAFHRIELLEPARLIPDEWMEECCALGSVEQCVKKLREFKEAGADEIAVADTVGYANPKAVGRVFRAVLAEVGTLSVAAHFHDTRGLGLANVHAALDAGVRAFDASLAGLGGCPYAPGATGNIVTEDLAFMLEAMGFGTGIDLAKLIAARDVIARGIPEVDLLGNLPKAGLPKNFVPVSLIA